MKLNFNNYLKQVVILVLSLILK